MRKHESEDIARLFNDWASADLQLALSNAGVSPDGSQRLFVAWLLRRREEIIAAVLAASEERGTRR